MKNSSVLYESIADILSRFGGARDGRNLEKDVRQEMTRLNKLTEYIDIESKIKNGDKIKVLEVGIGYSFVTTAISKKFNQKEVEIHAVEHPGRDELRDNNFCQHMKDTGVILKEADICNFPWPYDDSFFDVVIFSETIEHLSPVIVPLIIKEMARILKTNGVLIVSTPNLLAWRSRSRLMRGKSVFDVALPLEWAGGTFAHIRLYTAEEVSDLCKIYGLDAFIIEYANYGLINKKPLIKKILYEFIYGIFPSLSSEFFVLSRKR